MTVTPLGIDIAKAQFDAAVLRDGQYKTKVFPNTSQGFAQCLDWLAVFASPHVCLEATGRYGEALATFLVEHGLAVSVVNPAQIHAFGKTELSRTKTDPVDATRLAEFAERMPFVVWVRLADEVLARRAFGRYLAGLTKPRSPLKNQLHVWPQANGTPDAIVKAVSGPIQDLDIQIEWMRAQALQLIRRPPVLYQPYELLVSVKGIAQASAIALPGELLVLPEGMSARQWVAMAGLDPRHHQSGGSVNKKPRISKAGNRYLRSALYLPALNAASHDPHLRGFYQHLIEHRGLRKLQAVCAVMRKRLTALHAMLVTRTSFDGSRLFTLPPEAATAQA